MREIRNTDTATGRSTIYRSRTSAQRGALVVRDASAFQLQRQKIFAPIRRYTSSGHSCTAPVRTLFGIRISLSVADFYYSAVGPTGQSHGSRSPVAKLKKHIPTTGWRHHRPPREACRECPPKNFASVAMHAACVTRASSAFCFLMYSRGNCKSSRRGERERAGVGGGGGGGAISWSRMDRVIVCARAYRLRDRDRLVFLKRSVERFVIKSPFGYESAQF